MGFLEDINKKINELKVISYNEKIVCSGNFLELKKGSYKLNNNETIIRETITKKVGPGDSVVIFSVTDTNKILLVIQPRVSLSDKNKINIEIPAGFIEENENIIESGLRELKEETGYTSNNIIIADEYYPSLGASGEKVTLLIATNCKKVSKLKLDNDEYLHYTEVNIEEFKYLLDNDYIKDVNARIGYYKYLEYLGSVK